MRILILWQEQRLNKQFQIQELMHHPEEEEAKALLDDNPDPTETEVRFWLAGNLCRCTGYDKIVRAVLSTAAEIRETAQ